MSKIAISGNASGTGTFTIQAPNSNTDRVLSLPDEAGTVLTSASDIPSDNLTGSVTVDGSGNVGIGTSSPNTKIQADVGSNGSGIVNALRLKNIGTSAGDGAKIEFTAGTSTVGAGIASTGVSLNSADLRFYSGGNTERMRIDSSGQLKVGTTGYVSTSVVEKMTVDAGTSGGYGASFYSNTSGGYATLWVGTGSNVSTLIRFARNSTTVGNITTNGTTTSYGTSSDYRLKENVVDMTGAIDRVKALKPSQFNFIADPDTTVDGFLAHEVQDIVPEAVTGTKDAMRTEEVYDEDGNVTGTREVPDYQGIDQSKLVPLLTGALQEAIARIETLEAEVATLKGASA